MGHDVTLFCSSFPGAPPQEEINGIKVVREGGRYLFNFRVIFRYLTRFRREKYDVVIDDMNKIPFFTPLYVHKPLAVLVHHLFGKSIFREAPFPLALYVYLLEKAGVALCCWTRVPMWAVSPSTKQELVEQRFRSDDISLVYNCVDHTTHQADETRRSSSPLIGYFGRLKRYKSADHLLRAFAMVVQELPTARLVIVGEGDHRAELEALTRTLHLEHAVRFTGFVDEETKVRLLQEAWFIVNTSAKEGWGLTVVEANACGTTVLGSNVPGLRDAIRDKETGLLYEYGKIEELKQKMLELLRDEPLRRALSTRALAWSGQFDWNVTAENAVRLMEQLVQPGRRGSGR